MLNKALKTSLTSAIVIASIATSSADGGKIDTYRDLSQTKIEVIRRAELNLYPLSTIDASDVRSVVADIKSLDRDEWAMAFIKAGDNYVNEAKLATDSSIAMKKYTKAQKLYYFGRWPAPLGSSVRQIAYNKERQAFMAAATLSANTVLEVQADYQGNTVYGLLGLPLRSPQAQNKKYPLVLILGGLDGWKESRFTQLSGLLDNDIAILTADIPGTGQSPVKLQPGSELSLVALLNKALENPYIDSNRIAIYGGSFGGYWSNILAVKLKDRLKGVISHSGPYDETFNRNQFSQVIDGDEYLYDAYPTMFALLDNIHDKEEFFAQFANQSLKKQGYINQQTADMLIVGGQLDTLVPTVDLLDVLAMPGGIKEAWINPTGIHMGRDVSHGLLDADINNRIIIPWLVKQLNLQ